MPVAAPQSVSLHTLDYIVIGFYLLALIVMGAVLRKRAGHDEESYFLAGRRMPGWLNGFSYAATCMNADVAPAYCGMTVITGTFICWWYLSRFGLSLMIGAVLFAVFWRRLRLMTSPEFYELRFSGRPAVTIRTWVALRSSFVAVVAWTGAGLLGLHKVAEPMLGWSIWTTFAVVIPFILFYVLVSGYIGVVFSDFFEGMVVIVKSFILCWLVLADFGGPAGLRDALMGAFGTGVVDWYPPSQHEMLGVVGVIAWTVGTSIGYGGDAAPMGGAMEGQRILSCKNAREASKMFIWTQVILYGMLLVLTLPALGAMVLWPGLRDGSINKELAYGMLLAHYLPAGLLGIAVSAILASIMGTVSSNMNFGAQVFVNDVYKRSLVREASSAHYLKVGRIVATLIIVMAIGVATVAQNVIDISVFMLGLASAELTANWAQWWWRFNGPARLTASFGGPAIFLLNQFVVFQFVFPQSNGETTYWVVFASMAETLALWVAVALFTKPEPEELLLRFYKRARPLGWWGPIAEKAGAHAHDGAWPIVAGFGVAALGMLTTAAATVAVTSAYVARWNVLAVCIAVALIAGVLFKLSYARYMDRLEADLQPEQEVVAEAIPVATSA